ncbi:tail fiber protein [Microbacterium hominis]|uniref:tail fiber protein n=1 Tax=Microbacterium hominis TaxID=162426 RepID=UPI001964F43C|nr:tail fiber protein [Microbacterium hominis]QRY40842.1 tail fiber protein [Microbacterium hominis]
MAFRALEDAIETLKRRLGLVEKRLAPAGLVSPFAGATGSVPSGWLLADGSAISRTDFSDLFAVVGTTYGTGNGTTTFNLPNLRGRVAVGLDVTQTEFNSLAKTGGAKTHTLTVNEIPAHDHDFEGQTISWGATGNVHFDNVQAIAGASGGNGIYTWQNTDGWTDTYNRGGGQAHNNLQPYVALNFIIKT